MLWVHELPWVTENQNPGSSSLWVSELWKVISVQSLCVLTCK